MQLCIALVHFRCNHWALHCYRYLVMHGAHQLYVTWIVVHNYGRGGVRCRSLVCDGYFRVWKYLRSTSLDWTKLGAYVSTVFGSTFNWICTHVRMLVDNDGQFFTWKQELLRKTFLHQSQHYTVKWRLNSRQIGWADYNTKWISGMQFCQLDIQNYSEWKFNACLMHL